MVYTSTLSCSLAYPGREKALREGGREGARAGRQRQTSYVQLAAFPNGNMHTVGVLSALVGAVNQIVLSAGHQADKHHPLKVPHLLTSTHEQVPVN